MPRVKIREWPISWADLNDDEAEAWELANKIISDLKSKYSLNEPKGVDEIRTWMDEVAAHKAYHAMYPPVTSKSHTTSRLEVPYIGSGSPFTPMEARTYLPAGATIVGIDQDMSKLKYIITYSV